MNYIVNKYLCNEERLIRKKVFIIEQGINNEFDDLEDSSYHLLYKYNNVYVGCCRFYKVDNNIYKIGRIAILKEYRKLKLGRKMMESAFEYLNHLGCKTLIVFAQIHAKGFYSKLGFIEEGKSFLEENIPHIKMIKEL